MVSCAWLHALSIVWLLLGGICALVIALDLGRHPQHMWIMNIIWPTTALFGTIWVVWQYYRYVRLAEHSEARAAKKQHNKMASTVQTPFAVAVANGALHCGSGCTLGDICAMLCGFATAYPVKWWLIRSGLKEKM